MSLYFKFILSVRLSNSLWGSDILPFLEFINIISILYYTFIEFITLLYTFSLNSLTRYKEYMIYLFSFNKFSEILPALACARAIGNLWSICLWVNILKHVAKTKGRPQPFCCLLKSRSFSTISIILFGF